MTGAWLEQFEPDGKDTVVAEFANLEEAETFARELEQSDEAMAAWRAAQRPH
jgi:hypothetical protein